MFHLIIKHIQHNNKPDTNSPSHHHHHLKKLPLPPTQQFARPALTSAKPQFTFKQHNRQYSVNGGATSYIHTHNYIETNNTLKVSIHNASLHYTTY